MPVAVADQALYDLASTAAPTTVEQVIQIMQQIDDCISNSDGLKWFNVSVRRTHVGSYRLLVAHAAGVSCGSLWMDKLASPGRTAVR